MESSCEQVVGEDEELLPSRQEVDTYSQELVHRNRTIKTEWISALCLTGWCKNGSPLGFPRRSPPVERVSIFVVELDEVQSQFKAVAKEFKTTLISQINDTKGRRFLGFFFSKQSNFTIP